MVQLSPRVLQRTALPRDLSRMKRPPERAFLWGRFPPRPWVAIVGRRAPLKESQNSAYRLAQQLAQYGVSVISGGAVGIDAAAHEGALSCGGSTLVVAASWLDLPQPKENEALFHRVLQSGGGYLTITPPGVGAGRDRFLERNQVMVGLSDAVVLGQTAFRGGGVNAMAGARTFEVPRFVLPCPFDSASRGSEREVKLGARLLWRIDPLLELLDELGPYDNPTFWKGVQRFKRKRDYEKEKRASSPSRSGSPSVERSPAAGKPAAASSASGSSMRNPSTDPVACAIRGGARTIDAICQKTSLPPSEVQHRVLLMTLEGTVFADENGLLRVSR